MSGSALRRGTAAATITLVAGLAGFGCAEGEKLVGEGEANFDPPAFEVELPAGWREPSLREADRAERLIQTTVDNTLGEEAVTAYTFAGATRKVGEASAAEAVLEVASEPLPEGMSLDAFYLISRDSLDVIGQPVRDLSEQEPVDVGGSEGLAYEYDQRIRGLDSSFVTVNTVHDGAGISINFSIDLGETESYRDDIEQILASWTWE